MKTEEIFQTVREFLESHISFGGQDILVTLIMLCGIAASAFAGYWLTRLVLAVVERLVMKSETTWDDDLVTPRLNNALSQLAPALVVSWLLPRCFAGEEGTVRWLDVLTSFYIIWAMVYVVTIFVDNLHDAMSKREKLRAYAVKGVFDMVKLIAIGLGVIVALSLLIGKTPIAILTALGASAAVLMLVFRDTILGLVASVQLTANKMLHKGDWVAVPGHDANGEVEEISLTTVKIRNWDNTVTTVPPYSLVSQSFRNYQPMRRSGGRRVERSIYIDMESITFCNASRLRELMDEGIVVDEDLKREVDAGAKPDGKIVNLSLFRKYMERWLSGQPEVRQDMTFMVRQMPPTPTGLPVNIYFFTSLTQWKPYEHFQSEVFEHIYAVLPKFGLRIFQSPAGTDIKKASHGLWTDATRADFRE